MDLSQFPPLFITFEGGEGVGKTTQIALFDDYLTKHGVKHILTKEPGGCDTAMELRKLLLEGAGDKWDGLSELLLMSAARHEHLRRVIRPSLEQGAWVVCDRFADTTMVYQGKARGLPVKDVQAINDMVVQDTWPNLTFVMIGNVAEGLGRPKDREDAMNETRFESLGQSFHEKVHQGFLELAQENGDRCVIIDAIGTIEEVHTRIINAFEASIKKFEAA